MNRIYPLASPEAYYVKLNNWLIDVAMPDLSGNAFKLLNFIYRQTIGSGRPEGATFSNLDLMRGIGVRSFTTIQDAIDELRGIANKRGNRARRVYIIVTKTDDKWAMVHYRINVDLASDDNGRAAEPARAAGLSLVPFYGKCESNGRMHGPGHIYLLNVRGTPIYKIGYSSDREVRMRALEIQLPFETDLIHHFYVRDKQCAESYLHHRFIDGLVKGEWFKLTEEDLRWFRTLKDEDRHEH